MAQGTISSLQQTIMEKSILKNAYMCETESLAGQQRLAQHCKSTTLQLKKKNSLLERAGM